MHKTGSQQSCLGCHETMKQDKNCAGCHAMMGSTAKKGNDSCITCHSETPEGFMPAGDDMATAKALLETRDVTFRTYKKEDIPEKIVIKSIVNEYKAVDFPHKQIIDAIAKGVKDNKLAGYFHQNEGTLCQGCHHNAPATSKPTSCASCHESKKAGLERPSLIGAYHGQCMGCHDQMGIKLEKQAENCTECHKKR